MKTASGKFVLIQGNNKAYIPNPLPPKISWDLPLVNALSKADHLLGYLAGESGKLPNPHILIRPFIAREAVLSSRIEGTQTTLGDLLAARAGLENISNIHDLREVNNYIKALQFGIKRLKSLPLSLRLLRELHEHLMTNVRDHNASPGEFRKIQNWIGSTGGSLETATYIPPSPEYLGKCLDELEHFMQENTLPPLIQIALIHYQFEAIHPFLDGNGRVGRLLIILFLIERNILPTPLLYLSAFFEATRSEYYKRLAAVTQNGDWMEWIYYFLQGVAHQAEDAASRAMRINKIIETWRKDTAEFTTPHRLVDELASNPFITTKKAAVSMKVSFSTMQRAIEKLKKLGILYEISGSKRNRVYCAKAIFSILEEPTKINKNFFTSKSPR